ncbi:hypothetical protein B7W89_18845 [Agrobacterium tumefaciens]|nr:hypothetical protein B7W89_18845 [Agrobacterium tumefaciens]
MGDKLQFRRMAIAVGLVPLEMNFDVVLMLAAFRHDSAIAGGHRVPDEPVHGDLDTVVIADVSVAHDALPRARLFKRWGKCDVQVIGTWGVLE